MKTEGNPGPGPCVVLVGARQSEFVQAMMRLAGEYELEAVVCDDLWMAVAETARAEGRRVLVAGRLETLAGEGGRFLEIAAARGVRCCCILADSTLHEGSGLLSALRTGAAVVSDREVPDVLERWLVATGDRGRSSEPAGVFDDELRPTREELIALLGPEGDA